jgi:glycosyltransferase involved in cell wall biosynthesis
MGTRKRRLRIGLLAPVVTAVPPSAYAGTERVVAVLAQELTQRGHDVTLYASGDSDVPCRLVPVVERSLWASGYQGDGRQFVPAVVAAAWRDSERYDVIHSHVEGGGFVFARHGPTPVVSTLHNRLDTEGMPTLLDHFADIPLVAISESQRRWSPEANWVATIHHGLARHESLASEHPGAYLVVVGRLTWEKGIEEAIEVARATGIPLRIAGKAHEDIELEMLDRVVKPAVDEGIAEYLGEQAPSRRSCSAPGRSPSGSWRSNRWWPAHPSSRVAPVA